jgi:hypothetical protein
MRLKISLLGFVALIAVSGYADAGDTAFSSYGEPSYKGRDGAAEARKDITDGCPKLKVYGLLTGSADFYGMLLASKLGIQQQTIAGCVVTSDLTKYADAYNGVITEYAEKKFGKGIFEKLMTEANQLHLKYPSMDKWTDQHRPPGS